MAETTDSKQMREDLYNSWRDIYSIVQTTIDSIRSGETTLRASLLKELISFLRELETIIEKIELDENRNQGSSYDDLTDRLPFTSRKEEPLAIN